MTTTDITTYTGCWHPWSDTMQYVWPYVYYPSEPTHCMGKAHVFECDHEKTCKCGAVKRVMREKRR